MIHLFIDTNIFLSFYSYTKDDLEQLKKLVGLMSSRQIRLYVPSQVRHEFYRRREDMLSDSLSQFGGAIKKVGIPRFIMDFPGTRDFQKTMDTIKQTGDQLLKTARAQAEQFGLAADKLISTLFETARHYRTRRQDL